MIPVTNPNPPKKATSKKAAPKKATGTSKPPRGPRTYTDNVARARLELLATRMDRIEYLTGESKDVKTALVAAVGMTEAEVRELLELPADKDLTVEAIRYDTTNSRVHTLEDRVTRFIGALGYSEKDGKFVVTALVPALEALQRGDDKSFIRKLRAVGIDDEHIYSALDIVNGQKEELQLTNDELFVHLYRAFASYKQDNDENVEQIRKDVTQVEDAHRELREDVDAMQKDSFPAVAFVVGIAAGFVTWLLLSLHDWPKAGVQKVHHTITQGKVRTSFDTLDKHSAPLITHWYIQFLIALGVTALVAGAFAFLLPNKSKSTTTSTGQTTTQKAKAWFTTQRSHVGNRHVPQHGPKNPKAHPPQDDPASAKTVVNDDALPPVPEKV